MDRLWATRFLFIAMTASSILADDRDIVPKRLPPNGVWPTPTMWEGFFARWADATAVEFGLDESQESQLREMLDNQWQPFIDENRAQLQPLLNEYLEARFAPSPPDEDNVRDWSRRAIPMLDRIQKHLYESQKNVRPMLMPVQQGRWDAHVFKTNAGFKAFESKLESWQRGEFDKTEWWQPTRRITEAMKESADPAPRPGPSRAKDRIDEELLRWDQFVHEFIVMHRLTDTQRQAAVSIARECKERALGHRDRYRARMERLEKTIEAGNASTAEIRKEMEAMYGPVDALFAELSQRLRQIPTTAQLQDVPAKTRSAPSHEPSRP